MNVGNFYIAYIPSCGYFINEIHRRLDTGFVNNEVAWTEIQLFTSKVSESKPFFKMQDLISKMNEERILSFQVFEIKNNII